MLEVSRRGGQRDETLAAASQACVRSRAQCRLGPGTSDAGGAHVDKETWQQAQRGHRSYLQQSGLHRKRQATLLLKKLRAAASRRPRSPPSRASLKRRMPSHSMRQVRSHTSTPAYRPTHQHLQPCTSGVMRRPRRSTCPPLPLTSAPPSDAGAEDPAWRQLHQVRGTARRRGGAPRPRTRKGRK